MGGSSSQPQPSQPPRSPINAFSLEDLYTPDLSQNTAYLQEPNPYEATGEQVATSPTKKNKATRNRQKRLTQTDDAPRQIALKTEEEVALAKSCNVMRMAQESGARDEDYVQKAMIHYQAETGLPFKYCHCWDILKDSLKFQEIAFPNLNQEPQGSNKRKSSGSSSFNTESGDASINLNNIVANDDDEVQEIRRPMGRDKAKAVAKNKGSKASTSSTMNDDALTKLVVTKMTATEVEQREKFIELKRMEVEYREREIAATEYRAQQEDMKLYLQQYDHLTGEHRLAWEEIRANIKAKYNLQF
ncbi:glutathione S-transferase T3-like protein [Tanacetum coccineum]